MDKYDILMLVLNAYWKYKEEQNETKNHIQKRNSGRRRRPKGRT